MVLHTRCITGTGGGPDKTILNSPRFLPPLGYQSVCAFLHPPGDPGFAIVKERARNADARVVGVPDRGPADLSIVPKLLRVCQEYAVKIWHGHDYKTNVLGLLLRRLWPMRLVTTVHGWGHRTPRLQLYYRVDRWALRHYERVICVSEDLRRVCLDSGVEPSRCHLVHNAIDAELWSRTFERSEAKKSLGVAEDRLLLGAVGRLSDEKGFDLLIQAVDRLIARGRPITLWIAGDGPARRALQQLIDRCGLGEHVRILGFVEDPRILYQAMDIYVLSSVREGLPNALLEAMAMETAVLATRIAGVPSLIRDRGNGLLITPGSVDAIVEGLDPLVDDPALRQRLGREARTTIETSHDFRVRMRHIADIYDRVMAASPTREGPSRPR